MNKSIRDININFNNDKFNNMYDNEFKNYDNENNYNKYNEDINKDDNMIKIKTDNIILPHNKSILENIKILINIFYTKNFSIENPNHLFSIALFLIIIGLFLYIIFY